MYFPSKFVLIFQFIPFMNNFNLFAKLLSAILLNGALCSYGQSIVTLEDVFESAEMNSKTLRTAFRTEAEAERDINVACVQRLPDIFASVSVSYIGDGFTTQRDFSDYQKAPIPHLGTGVSVGINQPIYTGGAISNSIEAAQLKYDVAKFATELGRDNLRLRLTELYLDLYKHNNLKCVVESNIISAREMLNLMQAKYEQGTALQNDITRYELLVANLELQLIKIDNLLKVINYNLVTIAGLPEGTVLRPDSALLGRVLPVNTESRWLSEAQSSSPKVNMAKTNVELSRKSESIVRSERLPKIGIHAGWNLDGPILVEVPPINRNLSYWYVGVGLTYNLSSLYKNNKAEVRSKAATIRASDELASERENLDIAVRTEYTYYLESYEELKTRHKSVELAERNYRTTSLRYAEGMALITDLLDAADSQLSAQQQLVNAQIDIIYHYYKLLYIAGRI